ncbi:MAG TPA: DUF305 domain-containing protein [Pseudonocardiaceae bacterium]|nr:DUF305 domain-containing protein [Pseudonocardiaceae bacterium]
MAACGSAAGGPAAPASAPAAASPGFGGTDLAWVQITIAMDEQLVPLLDLAPTHSRRADVIALADAVERTCAQELSVLRRLHDQARLPAGNPHEGMPMPGMVTPAQVTAAAATRGGTFDTLLLRDLTGHLRQGVQLATSERTAGVEPQTLALARQVLDSRAGYLTRVQALSRQ